MRIMGATHCQVLLAGRLSRLRLRQRRSQPDYRAAEDLGIPVLIHTGSSVFKGSRLSYGDPLHRG